MTLDEMTRLAKSGDAEAAMRLGDYFMQDNARLDEKERCTNALSWYEIAAETGDLRGIRSAMRAYDSLAYEYKYDTEWDKAIDAWLKSAKWSVRVQRHPDASEEEKIEAVRMLKEAQYGTVLGLYESKDYQNAIKGAEILNSCVMRDAILTGLCMIQYGRLQKDDAMVQRGIRKVLPIEYDTDYLESLKEQEYFEQLKYSEAVSFLALTWQNGAFGEVRDVDRAYRIEKRAYDALREYNEHVANVLSEYLSQYQTRSDLHDSKLSQRETSPSEPVRPQMPDEDASEKVMLQMQYFLTHNQLGNALSFAEQAAQEGNPNGLYLATGYLIQSCKTMLGMTPDKISSMWTQIAQYSLKTCDLAEKYIIHPNAMIELKQEMYSVLREACYQFGLVSYFNDIGFDEALSKLKTEDRTNVRIFVLRGLLMTSYAQSKIDNSLYQEGVQTMALLKHGEDYLRTLGDACAPEQNVVSAAAQILANAYRTGTMGFQQNLEVAYSILYSVYEACSFPPVKNILEQELRRYKRNLFGKIKYLE